MRITLLQLPSRWAAWDVQMSTVTGLLRGGDETDLIVLPEASLTGYVSPDGDFDLRPFAAAREGLFEGLRAVARDARAHVLGPFIDEQHGMYFNAVTVLAPDGSEIARYRKRHPWYPERWASPGSDPYPVFSIADRRVTVAICFDIHFLANDGRDALRDADVLAFPSAWVEEEDQRATLLSSLAREHDILIANANWAPGDVRVPGQGQSMFVSPQGVERTTKEGAARLDRIV